MSGAPLYRVSPDVGAHSGGGLGGDKPGQAAAARRSPDISSSRREKVRRSFMDVAERNRRMEVTYVSHLVSYALSFLATLIKMV